MKMLPSEWARLTVIALHTAMVISLCIWCGPVPGVILSVPLQAGILGLHRERVYTAKWSSLCVCFYVAAFLVEAYASPPHRVIGTRLSVLAMLDFMGLLLFVRWRRLEQPAIAARMGSSGAAAR